MHRTRHSHAFTLIDLLIVIFLILVISTFSLAQLGHNRETAYRVKCASNLKNIGLAVMMYANDNRGSYPSGLYDIGSADKPTAFTNPNAQLAPNETGDTMYCKAGPGPNDVTAAMFRLIQTEDIAPDVFLCPTVQSAAKNKPAKIDPKASCNFADVSQLDYSFANPYPSQEAIAKGYKLDNTLSAEFAVAADMNPGVPELTKIQPDAPQGEIRKINSKNHGGDGQNVLYADGHVMFVQTPYYGVHRDNIYTYGNSGMDDNKKVLGAGDGVVGSPDDADDSVLLPTAK
jgi:prepilin-type processing-associated H-X9-DG protein